MFSKNTGKQKGGEVTMREILEILEEDATEKNLNTLSTTRNIPIEFPVREVLGNRTGQVLLIAGQRFNLDYLFISGAAFWKFIWYYCHIKGLPNGDTRIFLKDIIAK